MSAMRSRFLSCDSLTTFFFFPRTCSRVSFHVVRQGLAVVSLAYMGVCVAASVCDGNLFPLPLFCGFKSLSFPF